MILDEVTRTAEARRYLLAHTEETELDAVRLLESLIHEMPTERLRKIAIKHRDDESAHVRLLQEHLVETGRPDRPIRSRTLDVYGAMNPRTAAQKYATILVAEERASRHYPKIAASLRAHGAQVAAAIFDHMAADERKHMHFCRVVLGTLNEAGMDETLASYRRTAARLESEPIAVELYDHALHFAMVDSWGAPLDPAALGCGLIIPNLAVGFVDGIGRTKTAFFYGLRANPQYPMVSRGKAILVLADAILRSARAAGYTLGVTTTANSVVERYWVERLGFRKSGENLVEGSL